MLPIVLGSRNAFVMNVQNCRRMMMLGWLRGRNRRIRRRRRRGREREALGGVEAGGG
jgi:hypothetical protein